MLRWSSVVVVVAGVWTALVPFIGPTLGIGGSSPTSAMGGMQHDMAGPMLAVSASTLWYHVVPGTIATLAGLYQLVAPAWIGGRARAARQQHAGVHS